MTKLTHIAVFPKVLEKQSVKLVYKVFDIKPVAAFEAVTDNFEFQLGIAKFVELITSWFLMNVKNRYSCIKLRDERCRKLTKFTAIAFVVITKFNITAAANYSNST